MNFKIKVKSQRKLDKVVNTLQEQGYVARNWSNLDFPIWVNIYTLDRTYSDYRDLPHERVTLKQLKDGLLDQYKHDFHKTRVV